MLFVFCSMTGISRSLVKVSRGVVANEPDSDWQALYCEAQRERSHMHNNDNNELQNKRKNTMPAGNEMPVWQERR